MPKFTSTGPVQWFLPKSKKRPYEFHKKPIAYSTVAEKNAVRLFSIENPTRTVEDVYNLLSEFSDAKAILKTYVDKGFGDEIAWHLFGW